MKLLSTLRSGSRRAFHHSARAEAPQEGKGLIASIRDFFTAPSVSENQMVTIQLGMFYRAIDDGRRYDIGLMMEHTEETKKARGYNSFLRKRVLGWWTKRSEEYKQLQKGITVFDGLPLPPRIDSGLVRWPCVLKSRAFYIACAALTPRQRVFPHKIKDREIPGIAERANLEPVDVWQVLNDFKVSKTLFIVLLKRRKSGLVDVSTRRELSFIQSAPGQHWFGQPFPMKNPWQKRKLYKSKYEP